MKRPMSFDNQSELSELTDVFYIDSIRFVTMTRTSTSTGIISQDDLASVKEFFTVLEKNGQLSCIVEYNRNYFSFWYNDDTFFVFHPMSFYHKSAKCVQFSSFECVQKYLAKIFADSETNYAFHSVEILKINNQVLSRDIKFKDYYYDLSGVGTSKRETEETFPTFGNTPHKIRLLPSEQYMLEEPSSYEGLSESTAILRCTKSNDRVSNQVVKSRTKQEKKQLTVT